jgi:hypothetical protein
MSGACFRECGLNKLGEREDECRDACGEHDESECRNASGDQPEPSRSELPSQSEQPSLSERGANEPKRQDGERGQEPARRTKLNEGPIVANTSLSTCPSGSDLSMLAIVGRYRVERGHLHHDSQPSD